MVITLFLFLLIASGACIYLAIQNHLTEQRRSRAEADVAEQAAKHAGEIQRLAEMAKALHARNQHLEKWAVVANADEHARELIRVGQAALDRSTADAAQRLEEAERRAATMLGEAQAQAERATAESARHAQAAKEETRATLRSASAKATEIIENANKRSEAIAGDAYEALRNASKYKAMAKAMENLVKGYGDEYLVPGHSLLDDLGEEFVHAEAGAKLKIARDRSRAMIRDGTAAACDYVEAARRETAIRFVIDAFNGKVDSVLSRVRHDNAGTLRQECLDAFLVVNHHGEAFRNARITDAYLESRLEELRWAAVAQQLKLEEREEQRRIREQIREEEKARREFERAIRETAREEEVLRNAMERAQQQIERASVEQRAKYEQQLQELSGKLQAAEDRNRRAISMAQQTRRGHVYIISNEGSFGECVYKIGLTRRLEPMDRIRELGDSSVPFEFDVHALIFSDDAPALEHRLHKHFVMLQINKVNHRKEFFRVDLSEIRAEIEALGLNAHWTMAAEAKEFRESQTIERVIREDPERRDAWLRRQLELDPTDTAGELEAVMAGEES